MNSLSFRMSLGISGVAKGTPDNPDQSSPIRTQTLGVIALASTAAGGSLATQSFGPRVKPLDPAAAENIDWRSFANTLNQQAQQFATAIRLFYLLHSPASAASAIKVGAVGAGEWLPFDWPAGTTLTLKPGEGFAFFAPTPTGLAVDAARHVLKVLNLDAAQIATYECGSAGV